MVKKLDLTVKIIIAFCLDLVFGDPQFLLHPVQIIGQYIDFLEKMFYRFKNKKIFGGVLNIIVILTVFTLSLLASKNIFIEVYLLYTIFSTKCLSDEGKKVFRILSSGDIEKARKELSYLVSRDTNEMDNRDIIRSTMETISENIVDGIIAPLLFMAIGGLPLAMAYKAINTMDSMLGYKNEKYKDFGYFSAKIDDLVNLIPARITGGILVPFASLILGYDFKNSIKVFFRDRLNHASPNSAHPEASVAGALGIQFGGKTSYFGVMAEKPTIGDRNKEFEIEDIKKNIKIMYISSFIGLGLFLLIREMVMLL